MIGDLQRRKADHYFSLLDEDESGAIDGEDFETHADRLAQVRSLTDPAARAALHRRVLTWWEHLQTVADLDDNDQITHEEWIIYWEGLQASVERGGDARSRALNSLAEAGRHTFDAMNTTDAGAVTEAEYRDWLLAWGVEDHRSAAFQRLDRDDAGILSEDDLVQATREFYLSNDPDAPGNVLYGPLPD